MVDRVKLASAKQSALEDREEQLDLVEPTGMVGVKCGCTGDARWRSRAPRSHRSTIHQRCSAGRDPGAYLVHQIGEKETKFSERVESVTEPAAPPSRTPRPAKSMAVLWSLYSNSLRAALPGTARFVGLMRDCSPVGSHQRDARPVRSSFSTVPVQSAGGSRIERPPRRSFEEVVA